MQHFDLCVIGSGPAGQKAAIQAAKLGKRVCVVEKREFVGGVAIHTGTIPSKALREAILRLAGRESVAPAYVDFQAARNTVFSGLLGEAQKVVRAETDIVASHFRSNGIAIFSGVARFVDESTVEVLGAKGDDRISADYFLIAVGTTPARPQTIPFDGQNIITSDEILDLPYLPHSMIVVGGGVIGTEYASMLTALGVRVTLVEARKELLGFVDQEIGEALQYHLRRAGLTLRCGERVVKVHRIDPPQGARSANASMVEAVLESGKSLRADSLLHCIGRQGATDDLNLPACGLEADDRGRINVDENFRTGTRHIYACGDVIGFPALASTAMEQGRIAVCRMFEQRCELTDQHLPYGIYSIPEISMAGWTEERLTQEGIPYESGKAMYAETARGQLIGDETGMLKLLIHQETHTILGVHAIGTGATELIHIGQTAIAFKATAEYFVNAVFNYPTLAECYKVAAWNGLNKLRNV